MLCLSYKAGTLELRGLDHDADPAAGQGPGSTLSPGALSPLIQWDPRSACHRAPASAYSEIVLSCQRGSVPLQDDARAYSTLETGLRVRREPRPFQSEALEAWRRFQGRGVVALPTGAGKSHVAVLAIDLKRRSTLVVAPTLDLVRQWYDLLRASFTGPVGVIGGGDYSVEALTVTTYDSAYIHMEHLGARFGLIIFDECHHLPSGAYSMAARMSLAPFRLGLSATPERADGRHAELDALIGPRVYQRDITEMTGDYLAEYDLERVLIDMSDEETRAYEEAREIYRDFVSKKRIRMGASDGWTQFVMQSSRSAEGRRAMQAYRRQRQLAFAAPSKLDFLEHLLHHHRADRALVFTQDNATAYAISRRFLIPVITHQTRPTERSEVLQGLRDGSYAAIATSKVLNEGVDVPEANVAIIVSGSGSVREHVQRLGRVLRKKAGDGRAILYELIAGGTSEAYVSARRRRHLAYR